MSKKDEIKSTVKPGNLEDRSVSDFPNIVADLGECTFKDSKIGYSIDFYDKQTVGRAYANYRDPEPKVYVDKYTLCCWVYWSLWKEHHGMD